PAAAADDDEGPLRALEEFVDALEVCGGRGWAKRPVTSGVRDAGLLVEHVFRQSDDDGTRPPGGGDAERMRDELRQSGRLFDLDRPLRSRAEHAGVVEPLERFAVAVAAGYLADEEHQGRGGLVSREDA